MFSVIIPVYNGAKFVEKAIKSVFSQTHKNWELIVVDDGSTDNTKDVLIKYETWENVRIIHQENGGVSVARNNGVFESKGEYIAFLDADDVWHENHLRVMADLIEKYPDAGLYGTFTRTELVNGDVINEADFFCGKTDEIYLPDFFPHTERTRAQKCLQ